MSANERQDPAEAKRLDKAVDTSEQPADTQPEPQPDQTAVVQHEGGPVEELRVVNEPSEEG